MVKIKKITNAYYYKNRKACMMGKKTKMGQKCSFLSKQAYLEPSWRQQPTNEKLNVMKMYIQKRMRHNVVPE